MQRLTPEKFEELVACEEDLCLSLLMPTRQAGRDTRENTIRFKNLLDDAERLLVRHGLRAPEARDLLKPLSARVGDTEFWQHQRQGMAAYQTGDALRLFALPRQVEPMVVVGRRFHVTPLIPVIDRADEAYVLALSQNSVRLIHCGPEDAVVVDVPEMPESFEELARYIDDEKQANWHTNAPPIAAGGERVAMFHGHGAGTDDRQHKKWLADFIQHVEGAVTKYLTPERTPLLLAATEPLNGIYREINRYKRLEDESVPGNFDHADAQAIHKLAHPIFQRRGDQQREQWLARHQRAAGQSKTLDEVPDILRAASDGQIDTLLVDDTAHYWGRWDPQQREVEIHPEPAHGDEDLLNLAAILTNRRGGRVHVLAHEQMPEQQPATAALLY